MPDIQHVTTIKAGLLPGLAEALGGVLQLTPPPSVKGRYALARAAKVIGPAHQTYQEQKVELLERHAVKVDGKSVTQPLPSGGVQYDLGAGFGKSTPAFDADLKALNDEDVELSGVRMISHAELGACPITGLQEATLLGVLLIDEEPE